MWRASWHLGEDLRWGGNGSVLLPIRLVLTLSFFWSMKVGAVIASSDWGFLMPGCIIDPSAWETFGFSSSHASLGWLGPEAVLGFFPILCPYNDGHQGAPNALPSPGSTQAGKVRSIGPEILTQTSLVSSHCPLSLACLVAWGLLRLKAYDPSKFICWSPISQRDCIWKVRWGHERGALMMSLMPL